MVENDEWDDQVDESIEKTLADPNHPIYKVMLALCALLTLLWTQNNAI